MSRARLQILIARLHQAYPSSSSHHTQREGLKKTNPAYVHAFTCIVERGGKLHLRAAIGEHDIGVLIRFWSLFPVIPASCPIFTLFVCTIYEIVFFTFRPS